jgi:hypothetical protein
LQGQILSTGGDGCSYSCLSSDEINRHWTSELCWHPNWDLTMPVCPVDGT